MGAKDGQGSRYSANEAFATKHAPSEPLFPVRLGRDASSYQL